MENRKSFELNNVMIAYNFIQVVANLWLGAYVSYLINFQLFLKSNFDKFLKSSYLLTFQFYMQIKFVYTMALLYKS